MRAVQRIGLVPAVGQRLEAHRARVDHQQPPDQAAIVVAEAADDFADRLQRHQRAERAGERAEHADLRAGRHGPRRRRLGKEAAVGRIGLAVGAVFVGLQRRQRAVVFADRGGDQRLAFVEAGVGNGVAGGEIVAAVEHDVPIGDQRARVGLVEPPLDLDHLDMRIEARDRLLGAVDLLAADIAGRVQHLAMQIGERDDVVVDDPQSPDAGAGEILQRRRAEPARADRQRARRLELVLPRPADAAQHDLPRIALDLFLAELHRREFTRRRDGGANAALHAAPSVLLICATRPPRNGSSRVIA